MTRFATLLTSVLIFLLVAPAHGQEPFQKCDKEFKVCIDELVAKYKKKGWLGILDLAINDKGQFVVAQLAGEGPAKQAGFEEGDILVAFDGKKIRNYKDLLGYHQNLKVGDIVQYTVERDGEELELDVLLREGVADVIAGWIGDFIVSHYVVVENGKVKLN
jgi:predicted metalloprotease with PDZ domain